MCAKVGKDAGMMLIVVEGFVYTIGVVLMRRIELVTWALATAFERYILGSSQDEFLLLSTHLSQCLL